MLDDLKYIHTKDIEDALGVAQGQWEQLLIDVKPSKTINLNNVQNVVLAGMGGSALPGVFFTSWPKLSVPFEICRNYNLPNYVNENTLVISSSYSGNTEESLSALEEAMRKKAQVVVVAAGGKLAEKAIEYGLPLVTIPAGKQPRMATFGFIKAFVSILEAGAIVPIGSVEELVSLNEWLKNEFTAYSPDIVTEKNASKQLANELAGKTVVVYSGPKMWPAANKFKICINENAKNTAWANQYPEFNHNEFIGWSSHPVEKPFAIVEIRSNLEHERIQKRFEVTERLLSGKRPHPFVIKPKGDTLLKQLLWAVGFADITSVYLSLLNGLDPTPVALVEKLKEEMNK
ncbi:MAG: bifunctional phosphoglucose/phosphomannose isomerase [Candidatus Saccharibacteria bacterium]|nr:bifunctional phosphoglucose/phosphomannose isomerase [Candidatus Saccharibacteria bacterium]